ncbi:MAG TPA: hypothetical protein VJB57_20545 [Dehalococcoidia bacterium]|nr:hypothetical protein [Dehalococcoidia bacterium]
MMMMVEWPGRCERCRQPIEDWADAGLNVDRWTHKACFQETRQEARQKGIDLAPLRSPEDRSKQLEWPMLAFLLMFHFGLGGALAGWLMLNQERSESVAAVLLALGIIVPLIGVTGTVLNIVSRRRIELVRQALDGAGGWKPGR